MSFRAAKRMRCPTAPPLREPAARERLIDDDHRHGVVTVGRLEQAALHQALRHRLEISGRDDSVRGARLLARTRHGSSLDQIPERPEVARNRQMVDGAGRRDARQRRDALNRRIEELASASRVGRCGALERHAQRHDAGRLEAEMYLPQREQCASEQPRGDQQQQREGNFRRHQRVTGAPARRRPGHRPAVARGSDQRTLVHLDGGNQRRGQARQQRRGERERQHRRRDVQHGVRRQRIGRQYPREQPQAGPRKRCASHRAGDAERQPFEDEEPDQPSAAGAERGAQRQLAAAARGPRQRQRCDVGARDEQHGARQAEQHQHDSSRAAGGLLAERHHAGGQALVGVRIRARQPCGDDGHLASCLRHRDAICQPREQAQRPAAAIGSPLVEHQRHPELGLSLPERRETKRARHHADDGERLAVQLDAPSDDPGVRAESPCPQAVRDHDDVASPRLVVSGLDGTPHLRADAEDVEQGARHLQRRDALGAPVRREVGAPRLRSSHAGEAMRLLTEVEVVGR